MPLEMNQMFLKIHELLQQNKSLVLATIISVKGSAPRHAGAKCLFLEDGSQIGTIGGGLLEYRVKEKAHEIKYSRTPQRYLFLLTGKELLESDMLCGGEVEIYLEPLTLPDQMTKDFFASIVDLLNQDKAGLALTLVNDEPIDDRDFYTRHSLIVNNGVVLGNFPVSNSHISQLSSVSRPGLVHFQMSKDPIFVEPVRPEAKLIIFGGGHIATFVADLAVMVSFRTQVIDDREDFANRLRFPKAEDIIVTPFERSFAHLNITSNTYLAILTRGHASDYTVLKQALLTQPAYIGMIASKKKRQRIFEELMKEGWDQKYLDKVYSPIGLDIGAQSPEEIAVSIVAELIQVRSSQP